MKASYQAQSLTKHTIPLISDISVVSTDFNGEGPYIFLKRNLRSPLSANMCDRNTRSCMHLQLGMINLMQEQQTINLMQEQQTAICADIWEVTLADRSGLSVTRDCRSHVYSALIPYVFSFQKLSVQDAQSLLKSNLCAFRWVYLCPLERTQLFLHEPHGAPHLFPHSNNRIASVCTGSRSHCSCTDLVHHWVLQDCTSPLTASGMSKPDHQQTAVPQPEAAALCVEHASQNMSGPRTCSTVQHHNHGHMTH